MALKMKNILTRTTMQVNLQDTMHGDINQSRKDEYPKSRDGK